MQKYFVSLYHDMKIVWYYLKTYMWYPICKDFEHLYFSAVIRQDEKLILHSFVKLFFYLCLPDRVKITFLFYLLELNFPVKHKYVFSVKYDFTDMLEWLVLTQNSQLNVSLSNSMFNDITVVLLCCSQMNQCSFIAWNGANCYLFS